NWDAGNRRKAGAIVLIPIDAGRRAEGLFGRFLKRRQQSFFRPLFLRSRGTAPGKDICNRALRDLWLRRGILGHAYPRLMIEGGRTLRKVTISAAFPVLAARILAGTGCVLFPGDQPLIVTKWSYRMDDDPVEITVLWVEEPVVVGGGERGRHQQGQVLS